MAVLPYTNGKKDKDGKRYNKSGELMDTSNTNSERNVNRKKLESKHLLNIAR